MAKAKVVPDAREVLLDDQVVRVLTRTAPGFNRSGLLSDLFAEWGDDPDNNSSGDGQRAFARSLYGEFKYAKPGSLVRQRITDSICRLINWHTDATQAVPIEEMGEDELIMAIQAALPRLKGVADHPEPCEPEV